MTEIDRAVTILRAGGLVAFPTETVYGLGADATSAEAVARIFAAKGRPANNPLIVHVADAAAAQRCAANWPAAAETLATRFWPGPLTIVVRRVRSGNWAVADAVSAGGDTIGLRAPDHPIALRLLREFAGPVAAPSANRSSHVSPTTAAHVRDDLGDRVDLILDGGPCRVGIESTVLDLTGEPTILRPGHISRIQLEQALGGRVSIADEQKRGTMLRSPGRSEIHYAPRLPTFRFERAQRPALEASDHPRRKLMLWGGDAPMSLPRRWIMPTDPSAYAAELYRVLREMDAPDDVGEGEIWIEMPPDEPAWAAVRDRLLRASSPALR
ncbi:MAG TPA: L-threonylcarbamoyladenylate synthase [Tepidisphaeraceae bacterium]|nr:L-threonylcarbamoyladenylate synthase [Tepidisphaeraceae bacterium]